MQQRGLLMHTVLKKCSLALSVLMLVACTACDSKDAGDSASTDYADIVLGESFTDLSAKLTVTTNRTDLIADDPNVRDFQDYKREFNAMYPNIEIIFEGFPDYDLDMMTRLESQSWDVCYIPTQMTIGELDNYFEPYCAYSALEDKYEFIYMHTYNDQVYGIPSSYNTQGIVYNKKVWADAGITDMPKTPDEFIAALKKIRENTDAVPLYTNYAAGWTLTAWDYYDTGVTGDGRYRYYVLPYEKNPFSKHDDRSGIYEIYNILYTAAKEGLIEDDPNETNWEFCKSEINNGEIGCMALGSWAVPQMQAAGSHPEDIGYMPFPVSIDGVQYATAGANFSYGVNKRTSDERKLASKIFVKFMVEQSGFAYDSGGISIVKGEDYSNGFEDFDGVELVMDVQLSDGEEDVFSQINAASGLALDGEPEHLMRLVDSAIDGSETLDEIIADWNEAWTKAQQQYNSEHE